METSSETGKPAVGPMPVVPPESPAPKPSATDVTAARDAASRYLMSLSFPLPH